MDVRRIFLVKLLTDGDVMKIVTKSNSGIDYLVGILKHKAKTLTKAVFWKIPHNTQGLEDIRLKIGRYNLIDGFIEEPETKNPKSELTLDNDEFKGLLEFISANYEPFKQGVRKFIPLDEKFDKERVDHIRAIFDNPDKQAVLTFIAKNKILPSDLISSLQHQLRVKAVREYEDMLSGNLVEHDWQKWFSVNDWVLGSEFVKILDERQIDTENIADYLMQAYDGFLDIIEIKRPSENLRFWASSEDHNNPVPSSELIKAITQASTYIYEVEREANSVKFLERTGGVKTIKPRSILIFGRSNNWTVAKQGAYRILNSSYHNLTILTYDHVLERAKRIVGLESNGKEITDLLTPAKMEDLPF